MTCHAKASDERARRFREAALPYIDDAYTLAHFLMRNQAEAEEAVQECYDRALNRFDSFHGSAMKTWLLAILRNVCYANLALRSRHETSTELADYEYVTEQPLRRRPGVPPNSATNRQAGAVIRRLVVALPMPFRETFALHEFNGIPTGKSPKWWACPLERLCRVSHAPARCCLWRGWQRTALRDGGQ
jgi:RNA polymerase sigma-70 factor, ECF subfamily